MRVEVDYYKDLYVEKTTVIFRAKQGHVPSGEQLHGRLSHCLSD